jgi:glyoxylase-like metal-dependent hydrolase (beta-lactamase superfamily II)
LYARAGVDLHTKKIGENLFLIDLQTGGFKNLIASYVLKGEKTLIVETGPTSSIPSLLLGLKELNVKFQDVAYIALSHVHLDHGGGAGTLLKSLPFAKVIVHQKGAPHLKDPAKLWEASKKTLGSVAEMFGEPEPVPEDRIIVTSESMTFDLGGGVKLKALETSGHASHNLSFYEYLNNGVFPGDAAGAYIAEFDTVFPTTPPPFRPDIALISLDKLVSLNPAFLYYTHFGKASDAVRRLRGYQVQIKMWLKLAQEGVKRGETAEQIRERIFEEDETIQKVVPALKSNLVLRKTLIENSVQGFIDFVKNPQI